MARRRKQRVREKGKISLSRYFQKLDKGQRVVIKPNASLPFPLPLRFRGHAGIIESKRGKAYVVKIRDGNQYKKVVLRPIHLTKIS